MSFLAKSTLALIVFGMTAQTSLAQRGPDRGRGYRPPQRIENSYAERLARRLAATTQDLSWMIQREAHPYNPEAREALRLSQNLEWNTRRLAQSIRMNGSKSIIVQREMRVVEGETRRLEIAVRRARLSWRVESRTNDVVWQVRDLRREIGFGRY